jgi:hypothetical protein
MKHLEIAADALDPTCKLKMASNVTASTNNGRKVATGSDAKAAVAIVSAPQPTIPATSSQTFAVPRSLIVARSARYSSCC